MLSIKKFSSILQCMEVKTVMSVTNWLQFVFVLFKNESMHIINCIRGQKSYWAVGEMKLSDDMELLEKCKSIILKKNWNKYIKKLSHLHFFIIIITKRAHIKAWIFFFLCVSLVWEWPNHQAVGLGVAYLTTKYKSASDAKSTSSIKANVSTTLCMLWK